MEFSDTLSDTELSILLKKGDKIAYTIIYTKYFDVLYIHALNKLNNEQEAQDIVQDLFAQLWSKHQLLDIHTSLKSYLYTGIKNRILDNIARKEVQDKYIKSLDKFLDLQHCVTDHRVREKQLSELIEKGISSLPEKMKEIFELSRKKSLSHRQIADYLNISEQTVKKQVNNALKILRAKLGLLLFF